MAMVVRRLRPKNALDYRRVRLLGFKESPTAFGSSYGKEIKRPLSDFRKRLEISSSSWVFGAFEGHRLVGIVRLVRNDGSKERHKASITGMYVERSSRRRGIAQRLLESAINRAKKMKGLRMVRLSAVTSNVAAKTLYEKAGFVEYGREEEALLVADRFYSESLMAKKL
jgi:ribosomal protein S18 acetylase RimI-like enzyme